MLVVNPASAALHACCMHRYAARCCPVEEAGCRVFVCCGMHVCVWSICVLWHACLCVEYFCLCWGSCSSIVIVPSVHCLCIVCVCKDKPADREAPSPSAPHAAARRPTASLSGSATNAAKHTEGRTVCDCNHQVQPGVHMAAGTRSSWIQNSCNRAWSCLYEKPVNQ